MDQLKRIDLTKLYPPYVMLVSQMLVNLETRGSVFIATSGFRSVEEQDALYAKGRTAPGGIITNAPGGFSAHQWGVGVDFTHDSDENLADGLQPDYSAPHYDILGEEAKNVGLEWGGSWTSFQDRPHIQLPLKAHGFTWNKLLSLYHSGGMTVVFANLDTVQW